MGIRSVLLVHFFALLTSLTFAQKGTIKGSVIDAKTQEPLIGATVLLGGTTIGSVTDFDGNYLIVDIEPGTYDLRCSFISYETQLIGNVTVRPGNSQNHHFKLGESVVEIEGVKVVAKANRESESMLLMDQKNASGITESIGSRRLSSLGISDAATASSKISGVTKNEGSGDIYIRGLGDRYLTTTMNGLPIPSDDVEKKNIDLNLFSTDIIKNLGIDKSYSVASYGDQSSGTVNINSKSFSEKITIGISQRSNTNVLKSEIWNGFRSTQNNNEVSFGNYQQSLTTKDAIKHQSWNTTDRNLPLGIGFSLTSGKKIKVFDNDLMVFATVSHKNSFDHHKGIYKKYRSNVLDNSFSDAETFSATINTTGLISLAYDFGADHSISFNSLLVAKTVDELYEQGRNGEGYVFDQDPQEHGAFVRDQNLKETQIFINQFLGTHNLNSKHYLAWAVGYNVVNSDEPNRIRNEVNILDENTVQFAHVGDFQQRKSLQNIEDSEVNAYLKDEFSLLDDEKKLKLNYGVNIRMKERDFISQFVGVRAKGFQVQSIDNLDEAFLSSSNYSGNQLILKERNPDSYQATLDVYAAYLNVDFELKKLSGNIGLRYEMDELGVFWDVANYVGRKGSISNSYDNILPAINLKFQLAEKSSLRFAASKTITLPEFKELSPFEYVSPTGRVTKGNPDLINSVNYNFDLKWELFPSANELLSATAFYKQIQDPINLTQTRGSSGNFIFENTGEKANVYGFEFEARLKLLQPEDRDRPDLNLVLNATKMWFSQDLLEEFQYNSKTKSDLQGAAGFILNGTLSYSDNKEHEFGANLSGNYSSDKILALGSPEDFANSATLFNNEIIEKGFANVELVLTKKLSKRIAFKLSGKNLLNPKIEQIQEIKPLKGEASKQIVSSYKKGINLQLGVEINLNK